MPRSTFGRPRPRRVSSPQPKKDRPASKLRKTMRKKNLPRTY